MEINLEDWVELNMELGTIETEIDGLDVNDPSVDLALQARDIIVKKLLVFFHLFDARSDRLEEILVEEPEYQEFLKYVEEASEKDDIRSQGPQERGSDSTDGGDGVRSWYGKASPISHLGGGDTGRGR